MNDPSWDSPGGQARLRADFEKRLTELTRQCRLGMLYVREWRALIAGLTQYHALGTVDSALLQVMRSTLPGQAIMVLARLVDRTKGTAGVHRLLTIAERDVGIFPYRQKAVRTDVIDDRQRLAGLKTSTDRLKCLRDKYYAHFDEEWTGRVKELHNSEPFSPDDAEALYRAIGRILDRYWGHLRNRKELMEVPLGRKTDWLLGFLAKSLEAADIPEPEGLQRALDELYHITEKGLTIQQREGG